MSNPLPDWTAGTTYLTMQVPWTDNNGEAVDLTGATLTGRIKNKTTGAARAIAGTLAQDGAVDNYLNWTMVAGDVTAGENIVTFTATIDGKPFSTFQASWHVEAAI